jgi:hypothetical protein
MGKVKGASFIANKDSLKSLCIKPKDFGGYRSTFIIFVWICPSKE